MLIACLGMVEKGSLKNGGPRKFQGGDGELLGKKPKNRGSCSERSIRSKKEEQGC